MPEGEAKGYERRMMEWGGTRMTVQRINERVNGDSTTPNQTDELDLAQQDLI
jgi:hypothetical protein